MKRLFKTRKATIAVVVVSFIVGAYHLYLLGRCDEINELTAIASDNGSIGVDFDIFGDKKHVIITAD